MNAPRVDSSCYVASEAILIGEVTLGRDCSIWPYAVLRADMSEMTVSEGSSIQEHCQLHGNPGRPVGIGRSPSLKRRWGLMPHNRLSLFDGDGDPDFDVDWRDGPHPCIPRIHFRIRTREGAR